MKKFQFKFRGFGFPGFAFLVCILFGISGCNLTGGTNFSGPLPLSMPSNLPSSTSVTSAPKPGPSPSPGPVSTVTAGATGSVALSWGAPNSGGTATNYYVYQSTDKINYTKVQTLAETQTSTTVTGLTDGTVYYFYVTAANAAGASLPSNSVTADVP